ncbi:MAG: 4Fe-4S dicluster domain-containing protein [Bacteroidota bacterium]|nr:4Fe-4S dicluster domain-containing protein [Bacteroidota bacterium]MDP4227164.1 4Fe-4S dicluster domain-containing protein [Bacteroidota bacterium]MDP4273504.1 4Fe-4S dicluster domain-containing protein [Bacteroidota bacterium]
MEGLFNMLIKDVRMKEGLKACINCGTCTAICPAAEFYNYDPRVIMDIVQTRDDKQIEALLKSDTIWYCGECMSCKTRCPRGNAPGLVICALRSLSQDLGYFVESEKGRQQFAIKRTVGENILKCGYCVTPDLVATELHPEQGPVWAWEKQNLPELMKKMGANYKGEGPGALRNIPDEAIDELKNIFEVTGANDRFEKIEKYSAEKAKEMNMNIDESLDNEYFQAAFTHNNQKHSQHD